MGGGSEMAFYSPHEVRQSSATPDDFDWNHNLFLIFNIQLIMLEIWILGALPYTSYIHGLGSYILNMVWIRIVLKGIIEYFRGWTFDSDLYTFLYLKTRQLIFVR